MFYDNKDYYFCSGVKGAIKKATGVELIPDKEIYKFAKVFKIYVSHDIQYLPNGKKLCRGIYLKRDVNAVLNTQEKRDKVKAYFENVLGTQAKEIADKIKATKQTPEQKEQNKKDPVQLTLDFDRHEDNRDKMINFINNHQSDDESRSPRGDETDMEYVSNELLKQDDVFNESKEEDLSDVETKWHPREGLFLEKDPKRIASYLVRHSKDKSQAIRRLTFYMNRAGDNLTNITVLNKVKKMLSSDKD